MTASVWSDWERRFDALAQRWGLATYGERTAPIDQDVLWDMMDDLSEVLREHLAPIVHFRRFCDGRVGHYAMWKAPRWFRWWVKVESAARSTIRLPDHAPLAIWLNERFHLAPWVEPEAVTPREWNVLSDVTKRPWEVYGP